ncbi:Putative metabolite transport protein ywtG [Fusarium oxysporum f. sp. cubense race 1]|uniref:Putative metabolite transport protein ywtG n=1 Tax=Fusarium oxysporum f. sp. cubense (strain race 1) TaxID=1229664 RepID=N4TU51_FUSC1|nr:Putative metabolite transport protein ywtG [Fusarium oxysporum f. sp. cubense race 1]
MAGGKDSFSLSEKLCKFKKDWEKWIRRQIKDRGGDRSVLSEHLPTVSVDELERAFSIAQNINYYAVAESSENPMPNELTEDEKKSSINAADIYAMDGSNPLHLPKGEETWTSGAMNAMPYFTAALLGSPMSLPINICIGRRGALTVSAFLIIASSIGSAFCQTWLELLLVRIIAGVAMGIKAVSAPVLASETAVRFWRGSIVIAWQLWVACGILMGSVINMAIADATGYLEQDRDNRSRLALRLILGAPAVPAIFLLIAVAMCYESPRYYMRSDTPGYSIDRTFQILLKIRSHRLLALRDLILIWWPNRPQRTELDQTSIERIKHSGLTYMGRVVASLNLSKLQYSTLFQARFLRNAVYSTCIVSLAQQLCGVNVFAFYSNKMFSGAYGNLKATLAYSVGFGGVNFLFGLLAMRSIDTLGRRRWLLFTLPLMSLFLMVAAIAYNDNFSKGIEARDIVGTVFVYCFVAAYAPGLGPIPFTLASESFPSSHREAGASVAITMNLFFAGLLSILLPEIYDAFHARGTLGVFSVLNVIAFILVLFLIEETSSRSLEDLETVYERPKIQLVMWVWHEQLPYFVHKWVLWRRNVEEPVPYDSYGGERLDGESETEMESLGEAR